MPALPSLNLASQSGVSGATTSGASSGGGAPTAEFPTNDGQTMKVALIAAAGLLAVVVLLRIARK